MPRTLVLDTATAACSVALIDGDDVIAERHEIVGRGHAEHLLPMIATLPDGGRAARILVDCGPGSFTGIRVGVAAARALAFGWSVPVGGYASLHLIAAAAFAADPQRASLAVMLEAGHGEIFMQAFSATPFAPFAALESLPPATAVARLNGMAATGNAARLLAPFIDIIDWRDALPRAADARLLADADALLPPTPIYGRAPDAKLPAKPPADRR